MVYMDSHSLARKVFTNPIHFIAFGFGSGLLPWMPGTWGTLIGVLLYLVLHYLYWPFYLFAIVGLTLLSIPICGWSARDLGVHDYSGINLDEIIAFPWVMIAVPFKWYWILIGFLLFRLFDVLKPWPIRWFDKNVMGGFGIILDDLIAAIFSWLVLQIILLELIFLSLGN
jgi:phosphatidylglycerophosphatase A